MDYMGCGLHGVVDYMGCGLHGLLTTWGVDYMGCGLHGVWTTWAQSCFFSFLASQFSSLGDFFFTFLFSTLNTYFWF